MNFLYSAAAAVALLVTSPYWLLQLARRRKYRAGLTERLGRVPARLTRVSDRRPAIWVHAVSVGEFLAVSGIADELRTRFPEHRLVISTTTATGQQLARARFGEENAFYFPLDFGFAIRPYLRALRPELVAIAETELWPNFIRLAHRGGARVAVLNARVSDHSFPRYRAFRWFLRPVLRRVDLFLAQSEEDARRLVEIGAPAERVSAAGNVKFDIAPPRPSPLVEQLRHAISAQVLVCGSTVEGEEALLLDAMRQVWTRYAKAVMVLAPRHPERFAAVVELLSASGVPFRRRSQWNGEALSGGVLLLDTIGELAAVYEVADLAFVGGSLVARGGHNILEPARCGVATIVGPHTENFRDIIRVFQDAQAVQVTDAEHLAATLMDLLADEKRRRALGESARRTLAARAGATARTLVALESLLSGRRAAPSDAAPAPISSELKA